MVISEKLMEDAGQVIRKYDKTGGNLSKQELRLSIKATKLAMAYFKGRSDSRIIEISLLQKLNQLEDYLYCKTIYGG